MTDQTHNALIEVSGLSNRFGNHRVHEGLNLRLNAGEILGVVGGSGSGKSVLLRSILGLHEPNGGRISLEGAPLNHRGAPDARLTRRTGVLFQRGALYSSLTLCDNIVLPLRERAGLRKADAEALALTRLRLTGLEAQTARLYPEALSGGMIKRAALARALALDPDLLFLDEPTAGLDPISATAFDELILTLRNALGLTVFLVTHDLDTLHRVCDRVAVLGDGHVKTIGPLEAVANTNDDWIRAYFHGTRGRAALRHSSTNRENA
ncbi:ABC transporter ATP-binding protein [Halomonadaceae bacterium KBTZ08]